MSWRASDVLLIFDILLDHCERCVTHGADEIAVRPKCWQACPQHMKFLPKHTRCPTLDTPQPADGCRTAVAVERRMHMIWHHFHFDQARLGFVAHVAARESGPESLRRAICGCGCGGVSVVLRMTKSFTLMWPSPLMRRLQPQRLPRFPLITVTHTDAWRTARQREMLRAAYITTC
jgi:hypothetical protein